MCTYNHLPVDDRTRFIAKELKFNYPRTSTCKTSLWSNDKNAKIASKTLLSRPFEEKKKKEKPSLDIPFDNWNHFTGVKNRFELRSKTVLRSSVVMANMNFVSLSRLCPPWWVPKDIMTDKQGRGWRTAFLFPPGMAHGGVEQTEA